MSYVPPFNITSLILNLVKDISHALGRLSGEKLDITPIKLRRMHNIQTIQASLAIEGNTLGIEKITHIFDGKRVIGPEKDILEVNNAIKVYGRLSQVNPLAPEDLLNAHKILMQDLTPQNGEWRMGGVGVLKGNEVVHMAPPAGRVPELMGNLFNFLNENSGITWLLKACIFHYELEFIHPFTDGNGRMGRLWQQLLLMKEDPIFEFIPVEVLIKESQQAYYEVLSQCDHLGHSTPFIEFSLHTILAALKNYYATVQPTINDSYTRLLYAKEKLLQGSFSRKAYLSLHKDISPATASRDLLQGLKEKMLGKKGEKNQTFYYFL